MVDEHVAHGPVGLVVPGWYLAPQRREVAEAEWRLGAMLTGVLGDGPISMPNPMMAIDMVARAIQT